MKTVSVIIPTLNAEKYIEPLITRLQQQTRPIDEILIVDSESTDRTVELARSLGAKVLPIKRKDFDHGGTRNQAAKEAVGEYLFFLSQDALPTGEDYIEQMAAALDAKDVVMVSARQIPRDDAPAIEKLTRAFNYPKESFVRSREDIPRLGIKAYFFSDVCSAYKRTFFEQMGGFEAPILTNEDMLMAAKALEAGKKIGYCATTQVFHSHKYRLSQQYRRNFDVSVFLQTHQKEIQSGSTSKEGIRMVRYIEKQLLKQGKIGSMIWCVFDSGAKFLGNRAGKKYASMSSRQILKKTSNPGYWKGYFKEGNKENVSNR